MDLCKRTQQLWRIYMTAREPGALEEILEGVGEIKKEVHTK